MSGGDADGTSRCCREPKRAILPWRAHSFTIVRNGYRLCRAFHPAPLQRRAAPELCEIRRASISAMALLSGTSHHPDNPLQIDRPNSAPAVLRDVQGAVEIEANARRMIQLCLEGRPTVSFETA